VLSHSERKAEERFYASEDCADYARPILVWPGTCNDDSIENGSLSSNDVKFTKRIRNEETQQFIRKAKAILRQSGASFITAAVSDEGQLLEFFSRCDYDEDLALFKLEASLGMGVLESLEVIRQEKSEKGIMPAFAASDDLEVPKTKTWLDATRRCLVSGATQDELLRRYEEGCLLSLKAPNYKGSSSRVRSEVTERLEKIKENLQLSKILRARAADMTSRQPHLPRSHVYDMRCLINATKAKKIRIPVALDAVKREIAIAQDWEKEAAEFLEENAPSDGQKRARTFVSLTRLVERGRRLRADLPRLPMLEMKAQRARALLKMLERLCTRSPSKSAQQRWTKWGMCPDDILESARPTLPLLRGIVRELDFLNLTAPALRRAKSAIKSAEDWLKRYSSTQERSTSPTLAELQALAQESAELIVDVSVESRPLHKAIEVAIGWVTSVRDTVSDSAFRQRKSRSGKSSDGKSRLKLSQLVQLVKETTTLGFATAETRNLKNLLNKANSWSMMVREYLARCETEYEAEARGSAVDGDGDTSMATEETKSKDVVDDGGDDASSEEEETTLLQSMIELESQLETTLPIDEMPEENLLRAEIGVREWRDRLYDMLDDSSKRPSMKALEKLFKEASKIESDEDWPYNAERSHKGLRLGMERLMHTLGRAREWSTEASQTLDAKSDVTTESVASLISRAAAINVDFSEPTKALSELLEHLRTWKTKAAELLARVDVPAGSSREGQRPSHAEAKTLVDSARSSSHACNERDALEAVVAEVEKWSSEASSLLTGRDVFGQKELPAEIARRLVSSEQSLRLEPPSADTLSKIKASLVKGDAWRAATSTALTDARRRLALAETDLEMQLPKRPEINDADGEIDSKEGERVRLFVLTPRRRTLLVTMSDAEWSEFSVAHLLWCVDQWIRAFDATIDEEREQPQQQQDQESDDGVIVLKGIFAIGVSSGYEASKRLVESDIHPNDLLICTRSSMLDEDVRSLYTSSGSDTNDASAPRASLERVRAQVVENVAKAMREIDDATKKKLRRLVFRFDAPLRVAKVASELLSTLKPLSRDKESLVCAANSKEHKALQRILDDLQWAVRSAAASTKTQRPELLRTLVSGGHNVDTRLLSAALPELEARLNAVQSWVDIADDVLSQVETKIAKRSKRSNQSSATTAKKRRRDRMQSNRRDRSRLGRSPVGEDLIRLVLHSRAQGVQDALVSKVREQLQLLLAWRKRARAFLSCKAGASDDEKSSKRSRQDFEDLVEEGMCLADDVPDEISAIRDVLSREAAWRREVESAQAGDDDAKLEALLEASKEFPVDVSDFVNPILESRKPYCICRGPGVGGGGMVGCDNCDEWYHYACLDIRNSDEISDEWICPKCLVDRANGKVAQRARAFLEERDLLVKCAESAEVETKSSSAFASQHLEEIQKRAGDKGDPPTSAQTSAAIAWIDAAIALVPRTFELPLGSMAEDTKVGTRLKDLLVDARAIGVLKGSVLHDLIATREWCECAFAVVGCRSRVRMGKKQLKSLVEAAKMREVDGVEKVCDLFRSIEKRSARWISDVRRVLHGQSKGKRRLKKLDEIRAHRSCIPIESNDLLSVEKILEGSIANGGVCICRDCAEKAAAMATSSGAAEIGNVTGATTFSSQHHQTNWQRDDVAALRRAYAQQQAGRMIPAASSYPASISSLNSVGHNNLMRFFARAALGSQYPASAPIDRNLKHPRPLPPSDQDNENPAKRLRIDDSTTSNGRSTTMLKLGAGPPPHGLALAGRFVPADGSVPSSSGSSGMAVPSAYANVPYAMRGVNPALYAQHAMAAMYGGAPSLTPSSNAPDASGGGRGNDTGGKTGE